MDRDKQKIIIIGGGETAGLAHQYFTYDSDYQVAAFSVEKEFLGARTLFELPVIPFEDLERFYSPAEYKVFVAVSYTQLNRVRTRLYNDIKSKGFSAVSYVSSRAFIGQDSQIGENCFILENNVIQYKARIANNVTLWSGSHIGPRATVENNCFVSSHVIISGLSEVAENCFIGVNSCIADNVRVARDCVVGASAVVLKDTEEARIYRGNPATASHISSLAFFGVKGSR